MLRTLAIIAFGATLALLQPAPNASAQTVVSSSQTYVCPKCGKIHTRPATTTTQLTTTSVPSPVVQTSYQPTSYQQPTYQQPTYQQTGYQQPSGFGASNVLDMLNSQRARQGVHGLRYDPTLQAVAQQRAQKMASMGIKNHPPGSFSPGRYEGVGWSSSYSPRAVSACFTYDRRMTYAGAAMARGRDGVYFAVVYR